MGFGAHRNLNLDLTRRLLTAAPQQFRWHFKARRLAASQTISPAAVACGKRRVAFGGQFKHMNFARSAVDLDERSRRQRPGSALGVDHTREPELAGYHGGV